MSLTLCESGPTINLTSASEADTSYYNLKTNGFINRQKYKDDDADPLTDFIHWNLVFIVIPIVSVVGVVGNVLTLLVIVKQGLRKSSNILLFSLALNDIVFIIGVNGPPKPMYEWGDGGFKFPRQEALALYYMYHVFDSLNWGSGATSLCIPVLITIERIIAVFAPLKFTSIVTRRRTIIAVVTIDVIFYAIQAYLRTFFKFIYIFDSKRNASVGISTRKNMYEYQKAITAGAEMCFNCMFVFVIFVGIGCVAIGIKIKLASIKRLKMTSCVQANHGGKQDSGMSRTTKTLLCLCVFYTIVCTPIALPLIPNIVVFPVFTVDPNFRSFGVFVYHVYKLIFAFNASCNFVIYVATSNSFRETLLQLFNVKKKGANQNSSNASVTRSTEL